MTKLFQNELEITRGEKRRAQEKIKILEEEHKIQTELLKREVEKKAKVQLFLVIKKLYGICFIRGFDVKNWKLSEFVGGRRDSLQNSNLWSLLNRNDMIYRYIF